MTPASLLVLVLAQAPDPSPSPWFPASSVCGRCAPPKSEGPTSRIDTWFDQRAGFALGAFSGLAAAATLGRGPNSGPASSPGAVLRGSKPYWAWGAAGGLLLAKAIFHGREEPVPVTAPWRRLGPTNWGDEVMRHGTGGRMSPRARRFFDSASYLTLGHLAGQPVGMAVSGLGRPDRVQDALIPLEAAAVSLLAVDQVKHLVHRPRPYAQHCEPLDASDLEKTDAQLSFFSGHTSVAFALAAATSAVASRRGLPNAKAVRRLSYGLAGTTGLSRVLADRHYATDVLVGAAIGWFTGRRLARWHAGAAQVPVPTVRAAPIAVSLPAGPGRVFQARFGDGFSVTLAIVR